MVDEFNMAALRPIASFKILFGSFRHCLLTKFIQNYYFKMVEIFKMAIVNFSVDFDV
jgi:hypothetical protein